MIQNLISIIIPAYNSDQYIGRCINSLLNQTYIKIEVLVIDDGSSDNTASIVSGFCDKDDRVRLIKKNNQGVSIARNVGIEEAKGEFILFVDSDDWIENNTCENSLKAILDYQADVVMWPYVREQGKTHLRKRIIDNDHVFDNDDIISLHRRFVGPNDVEIRHPENMDSLCTVWGKLYKSSIIEDNNIRFIDIREIGSYEDGVFNLDYYSCVDKAVYINQYLYHYQVNSTSITNSFNANLENQRCALYRELKRRIDNNNWDVSYYNALNNRICIDVLGLGINILSMDAPHLLKMDSLSKLIMNQVRIDALNSFCVSEMPLHWKAFYSSVKHKRIRIVYILLRIIQLIRRRK